MRVEGYQALLILAAVFVAVETVTGTFVLLGMAVGAFVAAVLLGATGWDNPAGLLVTFGVVSAVATVAMRRAFRGRADASPPEDDVNRY